MTIDSWWATDCPICGETETVSAQEETIRYCSDCKFQWSTELPEHMVITLAVGHLRNQNEGAKTE